LLETCKKKETSLEKIEEACRYLNPFYIDTRYPVHWPTRYDKETAIKAKDSASEIGKWVKKFFKL